MVWKVSESEWKKEQNRMSGIPDSEPTPKKPQGQNIKLNGRPIEDVHREKEILDRHARRVASNREIRDAQRPAPEPSRLSSLFGAVKSQAINWGNRINDTHERNEGSRGNRRRGERRESSHFNIDTGGLLNPNFNRDTGSPFGSSAGMFNMQNPFEQKEPKAKKPKQPSGNQTIRIVHEYPGSPPPQRKGKKSTRSSMAMNRYDPFAVPKSLKKFF